MCPPYNIYGEMGEVAKKFELIFRYVFKGDAKNALDSH